MKVTLLSYTPDAVQLMTTAGKLCYSKGGPEAVQERVLKMSSTDQQEFVRGLIEQDHGSVLEHPSFTFGIEGISRACSHQLVRHRLGSFSQQSQRYVNMEHAASQDFVRPPEVAADPDSRLIFADGVIEAADHYSQLVENLRERGARGEAANEDARFLLPNACPTNVIWTTNFRNLMHVCGLRLCRRAQWEIRGLFKEIVEELRCETDDPDLVFLSEFLQPVCLKLGYCGQGDRGCGMTPTKERVLTAAHQAGIYDKQA